MVDWYAHPMTHIFLSLHVGIFMFWIYHLIIMDSGISKQHWNIFNVNCQNVKRHTKELFILPNKELCSSRSKENGFSHHEIRDFHSHINDRIHVPLKKMGPFVALECYYTQVGNAKVHLITLLILEKTIGKCYTNLLRSSPQCNDMLYLTERVIDL